MFLEVIDLGRIDYLAAWNLQKSRLAQIHKHQSAPTLFVCQHLPVITLGRQASAKSFRVSPEKISACGIPVYQIERGGDITYHGPEQAILYPVVDLRTLKKDIHWYLRKLEQIAVETLGDFGLFSKTITGLTGVWVGEKKIASLGVALKNWITYHGLSINVKRGGDQGFSLVRPCGMDIQMASLEGCLDKDIPMGVFKAALIKNFARGFGFEPKTSIYNEGGKHG